jgi:hypothetical protein
MAEFAAERDGVAFAAEGLSINFYFLPLFLKPESRWGAPSFFFSELRLKHDLEPGCAFEFESEVV